MEEKVGDLDMRAAIYRMMRFTDMDAYPILEELR